MESVFAPQKEQTTKGLLVIYVNIGQLPPFKANAFVEKMKESANLEATRKVCDILYIPVRDRPTKVEYIPFEQ